MKTAERRQSLRLCSDHWQQLLKAMTDQGFTFAEMSTGPIRAAQDLIVGNAAFLARDKTHLIDNGCPLCLLNAEHRFHCLRADCTTYYDVLVEHAAEQMGRVRLAFAAMYTTPATLRSLWDNT